MTMRLTELTSCGGCAAKWGATSLHELLRLDGEPTPHDGLLVGLTPSDDAAVLRLSDDLALVSTTDFFPPLVDDPDDYGAIAAANACSDVFAMGGEVVLALNVAALPEDLPVDIVRRIFAAAAAVVAEAGGVVAGGHTIRSPEPIFGLAVQGLVRPGRQLTKGGAQSGDVLVLSKPLGTGLALASGVADTMAIATNGMRQLNRDASRALVATGEAHAVTDVTGFGLAGHAWEMAERSDAALVFDGSLLPSYPGVLAAAQSGVRTGGDSRNRAYVGSHSVVSTRADLAALWFDPQTSGGLLAAIAPSVLDELAPAGFVPIGTVAEGPARVELR